MATNKEILKRASSAEIRLLFLLHHYRQPMEYSESHLDQARDIWHRFQQFFGHLVQLKWSHRSHGPDNDQLKESYHQIKLQVDQAIRHDFDLPTVIRLFQELVKQTNRYV